jgi:hypothetical protein
MLAANNTAAITTTAGISFLTALTIESTPAIEVVTDDGRSVPTVGALLAVPSWSACALFVS